MRHLHESLGGDDAGWPDAIWIEVKTAIQNVKAVVTVGVFEIQHPAPTAHIVKRIQNDNGIAVARYNHGRLAQREAVIFGEIEHGAGDAIDHGSPECVVAQVCEGRCCPERTGEGIFKPIIRCDVGSGKRAARAD